jgi:hypothetical protein
MLSSKKLGEPVGTKNIYEAKVGNDIYVVVTNEELINESLTNLIANLSGADEEVSIEEIKNKPLVIYKVERVFVK